MDFEFDFARTRPMKITCYESFKTEFAKFMVYFKKMKDSWTFNQLLLKKILFPFYQKIIQVRYGCFKFFLKKIKGFKNEKNSVLILKVRSIFKLQ